MYSKRLFLFLIVQLMIKFSFVFAENEIDDKNDVLLESLHQTTINSCRENDLEDKLNLVQNGFNEFTSCSERTLNMELVAQDMLQSKLDGKVAEMSIRQCAKSSEAKSCIKKIMDAVSLCEKAKDRPVLSLITTMYNRALDFACYNNGIHLTNFVEKNGLDCVANKSDELAQCFDYLTLETEEVSEIDEFANCMVNQMTTCRTIPGTIIRSMFAYMRQGARDPAVPVTTATAAR